jgi:glycosyltransferase involved in cell wall biosynthesis
MPTENPKIFIVIAAYNESRAIREVVDKLLYSYRNIVVVDDGSMDDTAGSVAGSGAHVLKHWINRGQGAALQTGLEFAVSQAADVVVTFDADGQHDVKDIAQLIQPILAGECDVTLGSRFLGRAYDIPVMRKLLLKAGVLFTRIFSRVRVSDSHNGLRALSRDAAASIRLTMDRMAHASEILDQIRQGKWRYKEVPVSIYYSEYSMAKGQSSWNAVKIGLQLLVKRALS